MTNRSAPLLVDADGRRPFEDRNRVKDGDHTRHPEFAIARWAVDNLTPAEAGRATVYTSGEHCPMCAAGHAWVGLGRIVYATSSAQLSAVARRMGLARRRRWRRCRSTPSRPAPRRRARHRSSPTPMKALYEAKFRPCMTRARPGSSTRSGGRSIRWASSARIPPTRRRPPMSTGCAASSTGSTTPSSSARRASRWGRCSPRAPTATTPPTTTASTRDSATMPTSTTWWPRPIGAGCAFCSTGSSTMSAPTSPAIATPSTVGPNPASAWFRRRGNDFDTFEGHGELIALNHDNPDVVEYTADVMRHWLGRGADGWRLDAAYAVPDRFWAQVLPRVRGEYPDAWFVGEVIHGDYPAHGAARHASTRSPSTSCGRRSGAASTTATSMSSTGRCSGTTNSSTTSCR